MERVPREQPGRAGAAELLLREATDAEEPHSHEPREVAAQLRREPGSGAHRRERGGDPAEQMRPGPFEQPDEAAPGVAVAGRERVERGGGLVEIARQDDAGPVLGGGVGEDERAVPPAQAPALELERRDRGGGDGERVEGAEDVVDEAGLGELGRADGAARGGLRLEHVHRPARVGEVVGGDEPVRARADDDGVGHGGRSLRVALGGRAG